MRLIRSKIRKREDAVSVVDQHQINHYNNNNQQQYHQNLNQVVRQNENLNNEKVVDGDHQDQGLKDSVWVFPPLPPQPHIYSVNQVSISKNKITETMWNYSERKSSKIYRVRQRELAKSVDNVVHTQFVYFTKKITSLKCFMTQY